MIRSKLPFVILLLLAACGSDEGNADGKNAQSDNKTKAATDSTEVKESQRSIEAAAEAATRLIEADAREEIEGMTPQGK
jgi:hypothetical protein